MLEGNYSFIESNELKNAIYNETSNKQITTAILKLIESVIIDTSRSTIRLSLFNSPSLYEYEVNNIKLINFLIKRQNLFPGHKDVLKLHLSLPINRPKMLYTILYSTETTENQIIMLNIIKGNYAY